MAFNFNKEIQAEIEKTRVDAENLIRNVFPQRIETFKALLASEDFSKRVSPPAIEKLNELKISEKGIKEGEETGDGLLHGNPETWRLLDILKPHYVQMHKDFGLLKGWLNYMIPKMEDGNNFGVDVLQSVLERINLMKSISTDFTYLGVQFSEERAKAVKKVLKHPLVEDYRSLIEQLDEVHLIRIQRCCQNLYRNYMIAYDLIMKNIDKVTKPRSANNAENLY